MFQQMVHFQGQDKLAVHLLSKKGGQTKERNKKLRSNCSLNRNPTDSGFAVPRLHPNM